MLRLLQICITVAIFLEPQLVQSSNTEQLLHRIDDEKLFNNLSAKIRLEYESNLRVNHEIFNKKQVDIIFKFYTNINQFHGNLTVAELGAAALTAKFHSLLTTNQPKHRYDSLKDLRQSLGPHINDEDCLRQLTEWNERAELMEKQKFTSKDLNLYRLLDSYGRVPAGFVADGGRWTGMYDDCINLKMDSIQDGHKVVETRYCLASIRHQYWPPELPYSNLFGAEVGVCLPKSCDPLRYKNKYDLVLRLMEFNWRQVELGQATLESLYCLPDEDSPLRMWWKSPWVVSAALISGIWLSVLIYATYKDEQRRKLASSKCPITQDDTMNKSEDVNILPINKTDNYYRFLSITHNFRLLFNIRESSEQVDNNLEMKNMSKIGLLDEKLIDLRCLDGIKVICMLITILSHIFLLMSDPNFHRSDSTFILITLAALCQNFFFCISGILNCYSLFKKSKSHLFSLNPVKWLPHIRSRYLRVMSIYIILVYYTKYLVRFTGSGPMWDYGTSSIGLRRKCENESWLWALLFGANFKPLMEHCVTHAWYMANDFQFFLITPIIVLILHRHPRIGEKFLKFCIAIGHLIGCVTIFNLLIDAPHMQPLILPLPHSYNTYMAYLTKTYSNPQSRIVAYLCGVLLGYKLYIYEENKRKYRVGLKKKGTETTSGKELAQKEPDWPNWFIRNGCKFSVMAVISSLIVLIILLLTEHERIHLNIYIALYMPTYHILFALAIAFFILLAATGHTNKRITNILAASFWKPLARLGLCISFFNIEFIRYLDQAPKIQNHIHYWNLIGQVLLILFGSYFGATVMHLVLEAPIYALLQEWNL